MTPARLKLTIAYDGTDFHGFAAQSEDVRTVEGILGYALAKVLRSSVTDLSLTCAGRTDAGVHALNQVVHIDAPVDRDRFSVSYTHLTLPTICSV